MAPTLQDVKIPVANTLVFSLSCALVMSHFVFSRAVRDSLLGNGLPVQTLPTLILIGTGIALLLSFSLSWLFRHGGRSNVIRATYLVIALSDLSLAFAPLAPHLAYQAFYILVSTSTAIGLSMVWLLAGSWISEDPVLKARCVPIFLVSGTIGGLVAGFGLVHLHFAESFRGASIFLALLNIATALLLSFHHESSIGATADTQDSSAKKRRRARPVAWMLAAATVIGATGSTLLDLTYRIAAAQHYSSRTELLHFFGYLQAALGVAAVAAQLLLAQCKPCAQKRSSMAIYAVTGTISAVLAAVVPSFALLTAMRTGEYAMRNSLFRFGTEMTYAELPNQMRLEVRPIIDVVGERIGDSLAAGLLQAFFWLAHDLPLRIVLVCLSIICFVLWKICRRIVDYTEAQRLRREAAMQDALMPLAPPEESNIV